MILGFLGVVVVAGPGGEVGPAAGLAVAAAGFSAVREIATRFVPPEVGAGAVSIATAVAIGLGTDVPKALALLLGAQVMVGVVAYAVTARRS